MKKTWIKKFKTFKSSEESDKQYYLKMSPSQRLDILQFLRESYAKIKKGKKNESSQRLRRVIKIFQQA